MAFTPRLSAPSTSDKHWIQIAYGGLNECIHIRGGSVLPNCVGYAWGRVFEINGKRPSLAKTNAENWYGYTADGYQRGQTPKLGAVMCWAKGKAGTSADGAGHVMVVEKINADGTVTASGSDYSGRRFYTQTFSPGYYLGSSYTFQGFIYAAEVKDLPTDKIGTPVGRDIYKEQVEVLISDLRARKRPEMNDAVVLGFVNSGIYNVLETRDMTAEASNGYLWYRVEADLWIATKEGDWTRHYEAQPQDDKDKRIAELEAELAKANAAAASAEAAAAEQQTRADGYKVIIDEAAAVLAKA